MSIQWYPGHMTKARKVLAESLPSQDVVIEVLDARLPGACSNPVLSELRARKPCIKVLTKADLADPNLTEAWVAHYQNAPRPILQTANGFLPAGEVRALAIRQDRGADVRARIFALCKELAPRGESKKSVRVMVVGVPNVGKSTLVNTLMNRKVAKVGDVPAVTKSKQVVTVGNGILLSDNPGLLWPKIENEQDGLRLAFAGSIPDTAIDLETIALWGAEWLLPRYGAELLARYKMTELPKSPMDLIDEIGRRRGALRAGGIVDRHKAAEALIRDFRSGTLGRISLQVAPR